VIAIAAIANPSGPSASCRAGPRLAHHQTRTPLESGRGGHVRCGECEAAGLFEPCFCPCCGRPLTSGHATRAGDDLQERPGTDRPCASCGAPTEATGELCARCDEAFQHVLQAAPPGGPTLTEAAADDAPTLIATRWSLHHETTNPTLPSIEEVQATTDADLAPPASEPGPAMDEAPPCEFDFDPPAPDVPKPWWDMPAAEQPDPVPALSVTTDTPAPEVPTPLDLAPPTPPAEPPPLPAPRASSLPDLHATHTRPQRLRPAPRPRRAATARPRAGRTVALALSAACLCIVGLVGAPHVFDLVWNAPTPAATPAPAPAPEEPVAPLPDTSGLVPATDPSAPPEPPPAPPGTSAPVPATTDPARRPARGPSRPDAAAANRAARLLQQRAASQAKPSTAQETTPAAALAPLPLPAADAAPPVMAKAAEPGPTVEDLGQAFEVTQVDVRPQVRRQVPPRRPDAGTTADVVVVRVLVSSDGRPADVRIVRGAKGAAAYDNAAIDAVKQWTFSPAQKRSRAVSCWVHVGVPFAAAD
jgi:protein TonB